MMTDSQKLDLALSKLGRLERIVPLVEQMLMKRPSRRQQAKQAGVSRQTLWRREKRAKVRRLAGLEA